MSEARLRLFQGVPIFGGVDARTLAGLLERSRSVEVAEGDYFFREGDPGDSALVLEQGCVSILKEDDQGEHLLRHFTQGDCFGEMALLDLGTRSASVRADVDCIAIELTARDLLEGTKADREAFALIYMNLGRELSRRLRVADDRIFRALLEGSAIADDYEFHPG